MLRRKENENQENNHQKTSCEKSNSLDDFSQHLRALDRRRLNGVGIHKLGFVERAYELALENAEFLPHYLTIERFGTDIQYFVDFRSLTDLTTQIREKLWNITIQSADIAYTDALEFYASPRVAASKTSKQTAKMPSAKVKAQTQHRRRRNPFRRIVSILQNTTVARQKNPPK
jgi:hypothetical protein